MVTCSAVLLEQLPCSYLLYSLHGSRGVRTFRDEDTPGDDVDFDQDLANLWSCIHLTKTLQDFRVVSILTKTLQLKTFAARVTAEDDSETEAI